MKSWEEMNDFKHAILVNAHHFPQVHLELLDCYLAVRAIVEPIWFRGEQGPQGSAWLQRYHQCMVDEKNDM